MVVSRQIDAGIQQVLSATITVKIHGHDMIHVGRTKKKTRFLKVYFAASFQKPERSPHPCSGIGHLRTKLNIASSEVKQSVSAHNSTGPGIAFEHPARSGNKTQAVTGYDMRSGCVTALLGKRVEIRNRERS